MGPGLRLRAGRRLALLSSGAAGLNADWLSYAEALDRILAAAVPLPAETVSTGDSLGRSVAVSVRAAATLPAWPNSAMDGFAVRSSDLDGAEDGGTLRLSVAGTSLPGTVPLENVAPGSAVRVMTGGPVPAGFDTVIRVEHTDGGEADPGFVAIRRTDDRGRHVRPAGEDMTAGDKIVPAGTVVHSGSLPVLLAGGRKDVRVHRRPRAGVLSSGDELAGPERFDRVAQGRAVPDTNRDMIAAGVREAGGVPLDLGVASDDESAVAEKLAQAIDEKVDLLVTTGGASMGERDLFKQVLLSQGFRLDFWRARIRPGSPMSFGHLPRRHGDAGIPVFGLPGNPTSAFVTFHVFVAPYLRACLGSPRPKGTVVSAQTTDALSSPVGLTQFYRVRLEPGSGSNPSLRCSLTGPQGSGLVLPLRDADGLAVVPESARGVAPGQPVSVLALPGR